MKQNENILPFAEEAVKVLRGGGVILYPTDTIWGLGCDACNPAAVEKITVLKNRPATKNYIVLVSDLYMLGHYVEQIPEIAEQLLEVADKPLTIIYPGGINLAPDVCSPDGSVAIRIPSQAFCQSVIRRLRRPILSTSANLSGEKAPARYSGIGLQIMKQADWSAPSFLEAGATGKASSIIKLGTGGEVEIIRP